MSQALSIETRVREQMVDVTSLVQEAVKRSEVKTGFAFCFVPHTTAAITINENSDPSVTRDVLYKLNKVIPQNDCYHHGEGNSDAHIKSSLVGPSLQVLIEDGRLVLGTWQGIYFCEFDGPRRRRLIVKVVPIA